MSDLLPSSQVSDSKDCKAYAKSKPQKIQTREATLGGDLIIRRALPHRDRRMIGAWCFMDHFGPFDLRKNGGLNIGPHPHMGLQTFTFLIEGKILHRDSLGSEQVIQPGQVNLMTAGKGIAHSEESLKDHLDSLHGMQLWIALPDKDRHDEPDFKHYPTLPVYTKDGFSITILAGEFLEDVSPMKVYSPLVGLALHATQKGETVLPLNPDFEYGVLVMSGKVHVDDEVIELGELFYFACGKTQLALHAEEDARLFIVGGEPFKEEVLLWWNFVGRSKQEFVEATDDWENRSRFGEVKGYKGNRLEAPEIPWKN